MAKQIILEHEGKQYTLEFTRRSVREMENGGFRIDELTAKPMTLLPTLFAGAFRAHHRFLNQKVIDDIFARITHRQELVSKLAEMYNEPLLEMLDEPEEDDEKKVDWEASW